MTVQKILQKKILEKYQKNDSRIIILNKSNAGYGAACNLGLKLARGEYISIVEPDNYIDEHMYENLYKLASSNNADIVKSAYYECSDNEEKHKIKKINWSKEYDMPD